MKETDVPQSVPSANTSSIDASLLSFVAAFVDTCGFIGLFSLFTAHVTGNFVLIGAELIHHRGDFLAKLLAFPVFVAAIAATVLAAAWLNRRNRPRLPALVSAEALLLVAAAAIAAFMNIPAGPDDAAAFAIGMTLVAAMGLQNALMRIELATMPPTTVMTGNVTQVTIDCMALLQSGASPVITQRLQRLWPPMLAFLAGATGGALGFAWLGFSCLLIPAAACIALAVRFASNAPNKSSTTG